MKILQNNWDRAAGWGAVALGALFLLVGWFGVSGAAFPASQLPYIISGGIGGLAFIGVGAVLLLSADLQDEWRKLDAIEGKLDAALVQLEALALTPVEMPQRRRGGTRASRSVAADVAG